jgi:hypothetical protein
MIMKFGEDEFAKRMHDGTMVIPKEPKIILVIFREKNNVDNPNLGEVRGH